LTERRLFYFSLISDVRTTLSRLPHIIVSVPHIYKVAQKISHYQLIKNRITSYQSPSMRLDLLSI